MTEEARRLEEARHPGTPWKEWGPYLSEGVTTALQTATARRS